MQLVLPVGVYHRLHPLPAGHRVAAERVPPALDTADTNLHLHGRLVSGSWSQHPWRLRSVKAPGGIGHVSAVSLLCRDRMSLLHQLKPWGMLYYLATSS